MAEGSTEPDGYQRRGKVFSLRLRDDLRMLIEQSQRQAQEHMPWEFRRSLGGFIVWAALQWKPPGETKPRNGRDVEGTVRRNGVVIARRVKAKRPGRGNTGRPGARRRAAKGKKRR